MVLTQTVLYLMLKHLKSGSITIYESLFHNLMLVANKHLLVVMNLMDHLVVNCEHYHIAETMSISYSPKAAGSTSSTRLGYVHTASECKIGSNTRHGGHGFQPRSTVFPFCVQESKLDHQLCININILHVFIKRKMFTCIYCQEPFILFVPLFFCVSFMHM